MSVTHGSLSGWSIPRDQCDLAKRPILTTFLCKGEWLYSASRVLAFRSTPTIDDTILIDRAKSESSLFSVVGESSGDSGAILDTVTGLWNFDLTVDVLAFEYELVWRYMLVVGPDCLAWTVDGCSENTK